MATPATYSKSQIYLHWIIVILVAFQIFSGNAIGALWQDRLDGVVPNEPSPTPHTIVGILILILMLARLYLRMTRGVPPLPESEKPAAGMVAKAMHALFYILLIAMPLSGIAAWFFGLELPALLHSLARLVLIPIILIHIAAALMHHFVLKTDVLKRIVGKN